MAFLEKFSNPDYVNANIYQFERRRKEPRVPTESVSWGPSPLQQGFGSRGLIDRVGHQRNEGPTGIQNITGFGQEAPNVVYDQGPEQFAKELALKRRGLDIQEKQVDALSGLKNYDAETRRLNAHTAMGRNDIAMFKAQNPNMIIKASAGGNYFAVDPQSGQVIDTGIPVGNMTQEGAINLKQEGTMAQIGERNKGNMNVQGLRNEGALLLQGLRNSGALDAIDARDAGALERLVMSLGAQKNNTIFREGQNTWRTRLREGDVNPDDPVTGQPPQYPRNDINLPVENPPVVPSGLNLGGGGVLSGGTIGEIGNSFQLKPEQMSGFGAAPGQYTAKPGQFDAPVAGKNPVTGAPAESGPAASGNVKPDPSDPNMSLVTFPDGKTRRVPNTEVQSVVQSFDKILIKGVSAGETGRTPAGQVTGGKPAGKV